MSGGGSLADHIGDAAVFRPGTALAVLLSPPPLPRAKLARILPSLLASELPFPAESCVWRFENSGRRVIAHVARVADVAGRLAELGTEGCDPRFLVPPGPLAWRLDCSRRRLPGSGLRAVALTLGKQTVLAVGRGDGLEAVSAFPADVPGEAERRLKMAFGAQASEAAVLATGEGAADLAASLPSGWNVSVDPDADGFLSAALALRPALEALDLRAPAAAKGAVPAHPLAGRVRGAAAVAAAAVVLAASSFFAAWNFFAASDAGSALRRARAERRAAVDSLAGYRVSARGAAAVAEADAAAAARRVPALARPDAAAAVPSVTAAAESCGVRLAHVELHDGAVAASGTAPDAAAAHRFAEALRADGLRAALAEAPAAAAGGRVSFFVQPSGEDAR